MFSLFFKFNYYGMECLTSWTKPDPLPKVCFLKKLIVIIEPNDDCATVGLLSCHDWFSRTLRSDDDVLVFNEGSSCTGLREPMSKGLLPDDLSERKQFLVNRGHCYDDSGPRTQGE